MPDWLEEGWAWIGLLVLAWLWGVIRRALGASSGAGRPPPVTPGPEAAGQAGASRPPRRAPARRKAQGPAGGVAARPGREEATRGARPPSQPPGASPPADAPEPAFSPSVTAAPPWAAGLASGEGLLTAVILSEVLGPPRSRRPYRPGPRSIYR